MNSPYLCKHGNDTESISAAGPQPAAVSFSHKRRLRRGARFQVLDKLSRVRHYKVGPNPRSVRIIDIETVISE